MHASLEQLISLRDGRPVAAEADTHVRGCASCRTEVTRLGHWRQRLINLPQLEAPADAWQKIAAHLDSQPQPRRVRRWTGAVGAALAASVVAAVVLVTLNLRAPRVVPPAGIPTGSAALAQLQSQSRYLEQVMQAMGTGGDQGVTGTNTAATVAALEDRIALVDYAINQANAEPRTAPNLTALWQQRVNLMQSLAAVRYAQVSDASWGQ